MRKMIMTILCLVTLPCMARINYNIPKISIQPVIDGNIVESQWSSATQIEMAYPDIVTSPKEGTSITGSSPSAADCSAKWYLMWDSSNLYIACTVKDEFFKMRKNYPGPYNGQDELQFCLNINDDPAAVFSEAAAIFDITAETLDGKGPDVYRHTRSLSSDPNVVKIRSKILADGYVFELALPWNEVQPGYFGRAGDRHGAGLMILDFDSDSIENLLTDFGKGSNVIDKPEMWNTITLVAENGCGTQGRLAGDLDGDCFVELADFVEFAKQWMATN